ncbi:MAG: zinc ribbon domain-containing protein [Thermoplasmata archaeon]|nr:zinc ribbon domain-containing protein [Thermoplasmata archaeon]
MEIEPGNKFVRCTYCDSQMYIDKSGAGFFYILEFKLDETAATGVFRRWAAGSVMAKNLDKDAKIFKAIPQYFPVYMFKRDVDGREVVYVEPAKSTSLPGMHNLKVPPGDIKIFDQHYKIPQNIQVIQPELEMMAYFNSLPGKPKEQALVYFPIWYMEYNYQGQIYSVVIDGSSGEVFADRFPTRGSAPYMVVAAIGFALYAIYGIVAWWNLKIGLIAMGITVPVIFATGYLVAKKW